MTAAISLRDGGSLPATGFGFWKVDPGAAADVCQTAIRAGYRHLDCACDYGNEAETGAGISAAISSGAVTREDLWVTSKLWNTYHAPEHVGQACRRSLQDLQLDYLDLYLIHFPIAQEFVPFETRYPPGWFHDPDAAQPQMKEVRIPIRDTWQAMEELVESGLVRRIGICNFGTSLLRDLLATARIAPAVLQVESHPLLVHEKLLRYCQQEQIAFTAFSPLGPASYYSLGMASESDSLLHHPVILAAAEQHQKTAAQVLLRWGIQRGTSVIPKTSSEERMQENLATADFELTEAEMSAISGLDRGQRFNDPGVFCESAFNTFCPIYE